MSNKKAKEALNQMKQEAANTVGVNLKQGYNGDITARQAGSIGGEMVKRMIESYESGHSRGYAQCRPRAFFLLKYSQISQTYAMKFSTAPLAPRAV